MRARKYTSFYLSFSASVFVLLTCATGAAQVTVAKPPTPTVRPAGPHRQEPPGAQHPPNNAGDVEGFVYWDTAAITQKHPGTCGGLAVVVSPAGSSNNLIQLGNNFKYAGRSKHFSMAARSWSTTYAFTRTTASLWDRNCKRSL
jgi:hypothetical protein